MEDKITLYQFPDSGNCYKIRLCLSWLGKKYEVINLSRDENVRKTKDFLSISPLGKVPVLVIDNLVLTESLSILFYLYKRYTRKEEQNLEKGDLEKEDYSEDTKILKWLSFEQSEIQNNIGRLRYIFRFANRSEDSENIYGVVQNYKVDNLIQNTTDALQVLENYLRKIHANENSNKKEFILNEYGICDIALFAYIHLLEEINMKLDIYPNISGWISNVKKTKNFIGIYWEIV